jgi:hypothetical protein
MITIEQLEKYQQIKVELTKICKEWANQNLDNSWQHYDGFYIQNEYIIIKYSYNDIVNNIEYETCYGTKCVSWQDMVEFAKTLKL